MNWGSLLGIGGSVGAMAALALAGYGGLIVAAPVGFMIALLYLGVIGE